MKSTLYIAQYQNEFWNSNQEEYGRTGNYNKVGVTSQLTNRMRSIYNAYDNLNSHWWGVLSVTTSTEKGIKPWALETAVKAAFAQWQSPIKYRKQSGYCHEIFKDIPKLKWCRVVATASRLAKKAPTVTAYADTVAYFFKEMPNTSKEEIAIQHKKLTAFEHYQKEGHGRIAGDGTSPVGTGRGPTATREQLPKFQNESWKKIVAK